MKLKFVKIRIIDPKGVMAFRKRYNYGEVIETAVNAQVEAWFRFRQAEVVKPAEELGSPAGAFQSGAAS